MLFKLTEWAIKQNQPFADVPIGHIGRNFVRFQHAGLEQLPHVRFLGGVGEPRHCKAVLADQSPLIGFWIGIHLILKLTLTLHRSTFFLFGFPTCVMCRLIPHSGNFLLSFSLLSLLVYFRNCPPRSVGEASCARFGRGTWGGWGHIPKQGQ